MINNTKTALIEVSKMSFCFPPKSLKIALFLVCIENCAACPADSEKVCLLHSVAMTAGDSPGRV